ncbi:MAG: hypothetical protein M3391_10740 [Actinomycetota bacterium]|nr:hypothetical protein [Actinomycetota bacterium]
MPSRFARPTWVVVAAMLIVVALIAAVLGASVSSITNDDDGDPTAQDTPTSSATPGASPTPFGKDFVTETSTSAATTDAEALAAEAIANLRGAERFRFELALGGAGEQSIISGQMKGQVDLSTSAADPPKLSGTLIINTGGSQVEIQQIRIGDAVYLKSGEDKKFERQKVNRENQAESGIAGLDTVDPVMSVLNQIPRIPASAYQAPVSAGSSFVITIDNPRTEGEPASTIRMLIDAEKRLIRTVTMERKGSQTGIVLGDYGDPSIRIEPPSL